MDDGKRRWIPNRHGFDAAGFTLDKVQVVANAALGGVGCGLRVTDAHIKHFPSPGQTVLPLASTAKATYHKWNGPEASPGPG
jgi:hypothetical protein